MEILKDSLPQELSIILKGDEPELEFTMELKLYFTYFIREFFRENDPDDQTEISSKPARFTSVESKYIKLAKEINGFNKEYLDEVTTSYIRNICYPSKAERTKKRSRRILLMIYNYLDNHLTYKKKEFAKYCWIEDLKVKAPEFYERNKSFLHGKPVLNKKFSGAITIDSNYINSIIDSERFDETDFYLAKHNPKCQWFGIIKDWDARRKEYYEIKTTVIESFETNQHCKVSAVIYGPGGSGKSTLLRRLAIDHIYNNFHILWITNLTSFCNDLHKIESDLDNKYLLIIEDWEKLKYNSAKSFLNELSILNNVRMVIGDIDDIINKEYFEYFDEENTLFFLSSKENKQILEKVFEINSDWEKLKDKVLSNPKFYNSPLYLILFVLGRTHTKKDNSFGKGGIVEQFKSIIINDLKRIHSEYPKFAKALFYWACIYTEHKDEALITWEALLQIAEFDNKTKKQFAKPNLNNPVSEILSYYLSIEPIVHPELLGSHFFSFHHNLLAEGLAQKINKNWYFDNSIKLEILKTLTAKKELVHSASTLLHIFWHEDGFFESEKQKSYIYSKVDSYERLDSLLELDSEIKETYSYAGRQQNEKLLKRSLTYLLSNVSAGFLHPFAFIEVVKTIITQGCKSKYILDTYKLCLAEDSLETLMRKTWPKDSI